MKLLSRSLTLSRSLPTLLASSASVLALSHTQAQETRIKVNSTTYVPFSATRAIGATVYLDPDIDPLRATQRSLGFHDVDYKAELTARLAWSPLGSDKITTDASGTTYDYSAQSNVTNDLVGYWTKKNVPIIIGPDGKAYLSDGHHTVAGYLASTPGTQPQILPGENHVLFGTVIASYYDPAASTHPAPDDAWWLARQAENNAFLFGPNGNQLATANAPGYSGLQPVLPSTQAMPSVPSKTSMSNDSYRSLTGGMSDGYVKSAFDSTGAKIGGFKKTNSLSTITPQPDINFVEFYWGDFLRGRVVWDDTKTGSALGSGQGDANLLRAPLSYYVAIANGIALARSEVYKDQFGRKLSDYNNSSFSANTQTWAGASLKNGLAKATDTYHMYLRDDSTVQGEITPSALSINHLHIDTTTGMNVGGTITNFRSVTINGGGSLATAWKDAALNSSNSTLTLPAGNGTVTFSTANTYTGTTTVTAGTLALAGAGSIAQSSAITVANGARFDVTGTSVPFTLGATQMLTDNGTVSGGVNALGTIGGSGVFNASVTLQSGAHLAPGNSAGTLTFANGLGLGNGTILDIDLGSVSDLVRITGGTLVGSDAGATLLNFTFGPGFVRGGTYTLMNWSGATISGLDASDFAVRNASADNDATFSIVGNTLQATVVPEPGSLGLLGLGAAGLLGLRRRRRF